MFQVYKKRDFSQLVGDTFSFFKIEGKNYYKNYFIINGGLLLVLVVAIYFLIRFFFEGTISAARVGDNQFLAESLYSNLGIFITIGLLLTVLIIVVSLINYTYPVSYLSLLAEQKEINTSSIIQKLKSKISRSLLFFLFSIFILFPIMLIIMGIMFVLMMIIIGIPLLLIVIPAVSSWISLSYYHYISTESGYTEALGKGYDMLRNNFWPIIGSTFVMYMIVQVVVSIVTFIPYIFVMGSFFVNPEGVQNDPEEAISLVTLMLSIVMIVSILFNYTLQNIILINQGIIYYSAAEKEENISINREIDTIGQNEE
ncbi:hypothetical protein [Flavobacterium okayamense]|uniref:Glycerophosphoryl diester phosphodiesterase membrane domain-containing protein n=1 Tax=Flavobacterium okayamense TaxID=2830782 RepID=A0ABN6HW97_9FLAO|nr:hypothetical protein [Flavobacterium okayamense]BCY28709.1 hypothetical protein KK2020170_15770 [Flavobacterium okayamense]